MSAQALIGGRLAVGYSIVLVVLVARGSSLIIPPPRVLDILMEQLVDFFSRLFGTESWPARWFCGTWTPFHGWLYLTSDLAIWAAYFTIPVFIGVIVLRRKDLPFHNVFWLFGVFILACGSTHLLDALAFWWPAYRLNALVRFVTAIASWATVGALYFVIPRALSLRSPQDLEREVQHRIEVEEQLMVKNQQLADAQALAHIGSWEWDIQSDIVVWSDEQYRLFGLEPGKSVIDYAKVLLHHPEEDRERLKQAVETAIRDCEPYQLYLRIVLHSGEERIVHSRGEVVCDGQGKAVRLVGTSQDVTAIKRAELELQRKAMELERSNAELERFAFVASHDLQEPLRKIRTFGDRLATRYSDSLGADGQEKLGVVVNASVRMQTLIDDLLQYSRLATVTESYQPTNLNKVVDEVLSDLQVSIERQEAVITVSSLPVRVPVVPGQMRQLFQNLIGNALKFHRENECPVVSITSQEVSAEQVQSEVQAVGTMLLVSNYYRITVRDHGIGFDESYSEQIFAPFQRLHSRDKYQGTGIGLAICKKVAENHHGFIIVRSQPGEGAEFSLFLPVQQPENPVPHGVL